MIKKVFPSENVIVEKYNIGFIPDIILFLEEKYNVEIKYVMAGKDRIEQYRKQMKYLEDHEAVEFIETPRVIQQSEIRRMLQTGEINKQLKYIPKEIHEDIIKLLPKFTLKESMFNEDYLFFEGNSELLLEEQSYEDDVEEVMEKLSKLKNSENYDEYKELVKKIYSVFLEIDDNKENMKKKIRPREESRKNGEEGRPILDRIELITEKYSARERTQLFLELFKRLDSISDEKLKDFYVIGIRSESGKSQLRNLQIKTFMNYVDENKRLIEEKIRELYKNEEIDEIIKEVRVGKNRDKLFQIQIRLDAFVKLMNDSDIQKIIRPILSIYISHKNDLKRQLYLIINLRDKKGNVPSRDETQFYEENSLMLIYRVLLELREDLNLNFESDSEEILGKIKKGINENSAVREKVKKILTGKNDGLKINIFPQKQYVNRLKTEVYNVVSMELEGKSENEQSEILFKRLKEIFLGIKVETEKGGQNGYVRLEKQIKLLNQIGNIEIIDSIYHTGSEVFTMIRKKLNEIVRKSKSIISSLGFSGQKWNVSDIFLQNQKSVNDILNKLGIKNTDNENKSTEDTENKSNTDNEVKLSSDIEVKLQEINKFFEIKEEEGKYINQHGIYGISEKKMVLTKHGFKSVQRYGRQSPRLLLSSLLKNVDETDTEKLPKSLFDENKQYYVIMEVGYTKQVNEKIRKLREDGKTLQEIYIEIQNDILKQLNDGVNKKLTEYSDEEIKENPFSQLISALKEQREIQEKVNIDLHFNNETLSIDSLKSKWGISHEPFGYKFESKNIKEQEENKTNPFFINIVKDENVKKEGGNIRLKDLLTPSVLQKIFILYASRNVEKSGRVRQPSANEQGGLVRTGIEQIKSIFEICSQVIGSYYAQAYQFDNAIKNAEDDDYKRYFVEKYQVYEEIIKQGKLLTITDTDISRVAKFFTIFDTICQTQRGNQLFSSDFLVILEDKDKGLKVEIEKCRNESFNILREIKLKTFSVQNRVYFDEYLISYDIGTNNDTNEIIVDIKGEPKEVNTIEFEQRVFNVTSNFSFNIKNIKKELKKISKGEISDNAEKEDIKEQKEMLKEGIPHLDDLKIQDFIQWVRDIIYNNESILITLKFDGVQNINMIYKNGEMYQQRITKGKRELIKNPYEWGTKPMYNGLITQTKFIMEFFKKHKDIFVEYLGEKGEYGFDCEVVAPWFTNTIEYNFKEGVIILYRPLGENFDRKTFKQISEKLEKQPPMKIQNYIFYVDEETLEIKKKLFESTWTFMKDQEIDYRELFTKEQVKTVEKKLGKLEELLKSKPIEGLDMTQYEILNSKKRSEEIRQQKEKILEEQEKYVKEIKKLLLSYINKKVEEKYGGDIEGIVFRKGDELVKLVDKDFFTKLNKFYWQYIDLMDKYVLDEKTGEKREGLVKQFKKKQSELLGIDLTSKSVKDEINSIEGNDQDEKVARFIENHPELIERQEEVTDDLYDLVLDILKDLNNLLDDLEKKYKAGKLKIRVVKSYGVQKEYKYTKQVYERTKQQILLKLRMYNMLKDWIEKYKDDPVKVLFIFLKFNFFYTEI